jgi:hypothetical protein
MGGSASLQFMLSLPQWNTLGIVHNLFFFRVAAGKASWRGYKKYGTAVKLNFVEDILTLSMPYI